MRKFTFLLTFLFIALAGSAFSTPENLYLLGNIDGRNWDPQNGVAMDKNGDVFTQEVKLEGENGATTSYFRLTTVKSSDWDGVVNKNCYGPSSDKTALTVGTAFSFVQTTNNWTLPNGTYVITVDFAAATLTAEVWKTPPAITVSPDGGTLNGYSSISVKIDGTSPIIITATFNGQNLTLAEGVNSIPVSTLSDGATGSLVITAVNDYGEASYSKDFTRDDSQIEGLSGTLPVLYINVPETVNGYEITDYDLPHKEYFNGTYWLDLNGCDWMEGAANVGSMDDPQPLEIKARGNFTRAGYAKKPFKLKLGKKKPLLGLSESKHFAIIAHADDDKGYLRNFTGFYLGRQINPSQYVDPAKTTWSPDQQPVEVVINGRYWGLYFLTESIRVDQERVNITELGDNVSDPALISGGYIVELDNYTDDNQITMPEAGSSATLMITPDTPELYSSMQRRFVTEQFSAMNDAVGSVSDDLWSYMDLDDAVRYYMVMEIIGHWEAYHGSTYLHRDLGEGQKWHFGPLWDCGHAFEAGDNFFYNDSQTGNVGGTTWISNIRRNAKFNDKVNSTWLWFMSSKGSDGKTPYERLKNDIEAYAGHIAEAAKADHLRWDGIKPTVEQPSPYGTFEIDQEGVRDNSDMVAKKDAVISYLDHRVNWLKGQWGDFTVGAYSEPERDETEAAPLPDYAKEGYVEKSVYVYVNNTAKWESVYAYIYSDDGEIAAWPGEEMKFGKSIEYDGITGLYWIKVPESYINGYIIFNNGGGTQIPGQNQQGLTIRGGNYLFDNSLSSNLLEAIEDTPVPYSKTRPVLFINTDSDAEAAKLAAKKKASALCWLDPMGNEDVSVFGSETMPVVTEIKGRGTASWDNFDKKPYKLKFDEKVAPMGMPKSKHFVLLPFAGDAQNGLLANPVGHKLAELIGMDWTPKMEGVEVMLDGEYLGFYFLAENIRPAADRVKINDVDGKSYDRNEDWILELDNTYSDGDAPYSWTDQDYSDVTYHFVPSNPELDDWTDIANGPVGTEEEWRSIAASHAQSLVGAVDAAGSGEGWDKTWQQTIDIDQAVRFYLVQEIMDDSEAFNTNFYMTHTAGSPWKFGPVWNFGAAFCQQGQKTMRAYKYNHQAWIGDLYHNRYFRVKAINMLKDFVNSETGVQATALAAADESVSISGNFDQIFPFIDEYVKTYGEAIRKDALQWENYAATSDGNTLLSRAAAVKSYLGNSVDYLTGSGLGDEGGTTGIEDILSGASDDAPVYYDVLGRRVDNPAPGSIYIVRRGAAVTKELVR